MPSEHARSPANATTIASTIAATALSAAAFVAALGATAVASATHSSATRCDQVVLHHSAVRVAPGHWPNGVPRGHEHSLAARLRARGAGHCARLECLGLQWRAAATDRGHVHNRRTESDYAHLGPWLHCRNTQDLLVQSSGDAQHVLQHEPTHPSQPRRAVPRDLLRLLLSVAAAALATALAATFSSTLPSAFTATVATALSTAFAATAFTTARTTATAMQRPDGS